MKKKRSTRSRAKDLLVTLLCLSGATISLWLFWRDFTAVLEKLNDTPIATVTWKYKAAQRKFSDRLIWDRLQQDSLVYNGDTIRTAAGAETTVTFEHSELQLGENTIIQIQVDTDGMTSVNLSGGNLSANASSGSNMQLRSGNVTVALQEGTTINANIGSGSASPLSLQVTAGSATIIGADGTHSVGLGEGLTLDAEGAVTSQPLTIIEPSPQTRLLKFEGKTVPVSFKWSTYNLPPNSQLIFETAADKEFNQLVDQIGLSGLSSMSIDFGEGIHYWRLYSAVDGVPVEDALQGGRITILDAPTPTPIVPVGGDSFTYRTKLPTIRFMWNGNEYASSYLFEIADNPQMTNPVVSQNSAHPSSIVSTLGAGKWYWRTTPYYTFNGIGYGKASEVTSFTIIQQGQLQTPQPISPVGGQLVNIAKEAEQDMGPLFSWRREPEASEYILRLSRDESMSSIVATLSTTNNYTAALPPSTGRWYWDVAQIDTEGNKSASSPVQSFLAVDKEVQFNTIFPPEGYKIANTRIPDIRFTWKNNLEDEIIFQISDSKNFDTILHETKYTPDTVGGFSPRLAEGTWYWRIQSGDGSSGIVTEPRSFEVVPQLPKAGIVSPVGGSTAISRPGLDVKLQWAPVEGADYYQVFLYGGYGQEPIAEELFSEDTEMDVLFDHYPDGTYRWTIQAFAEETPMSTRVTGLLSESFFALKKIYPVTLQNPVPGAQYDGMDAYLHPDTLRFSSRSPIEGYEIIITKGDYRSNIPKEYGTAGTIPQQAIVYRGTNRKLPPLSEGTYWWTVNAITEGSHDISNHIPSSFIVNPIEPFPPAEGLQPEDGTVYDENYLVDSTSIQLRWNTIKGAEAYQLLISNAETRQEVMDIIIPSVANLSTNGYTLDLTKLGLGTFNWTIKARQYLPTNKPRNWVEDMVLKNGQPATGSFVVTLPQEEIITYETGDLYGN